MIEAEATASLLSDLANLGVAAAAIAGAIAAFIGLNTWKAQFQWQQDHDLARLILLKLRNYQDQFRATRSRLVSSGEMQFAFGEPFNALDSNVMERAYLAALHLRLKNLQSSGNDLYPKIVEADVVWGTNLEASFKQMRHLEIKVGLAIRQTEQFGEADSKDDHALATREIAFGDEGDSTDNQFQEAGNLIFEASKLRLGRAP